jgi:phosphomannomutase
VVAARLAALRRRLSEVRQEIEVGFVAHGTVPTPFDRIGLVMRTLLESCRDQDLLLVDGVKARYADGWALAAPDPDAPVTHVWAEAADAFGAAARLADWTDRVRSLAGGAGDGDGAGG